MGRVTVIEILTLNRFLAHWKSRIERLSNANKGIAQLHICKLLFV